MSWNKNAPLFSEHDIRELEAIKEICRTRDTERRTVITETEFNNLLRLGRSTSKYIRLSELMAKYRHQRFIKKPKP